MKAVITFSDASTLTIKETDCINPILPSVCNDTPSASIGNPVEVYSHVHNGLIPALMEAFCNCDYFYINHEYSIAYCTKAIVNITTDL